MKPESDRAARVIIEIPLTQGQVAIVDAVDAELARFKWHAKSRGRTFHGERNIRDVGGRWMHVKLHRVVWARAHPGEPMPPSLDHRDGDGLNCRRGNLRAATATQNQYNRRRAINNKSGFKGVRQERGRWRASISSDETLHFLGYFATPKEAALAYDNAARELHGEFACVNFPMSGESEALRSTYRCPDPVATKQGRGERNA